MKWIDIQEGIEEEHFPEHKEMLLVGDIYSDVVTLGRFIVEGEDEGHFEMMSIEPIEFDSQPTHIMKIPRLPRDENEMDR